MSLVKGHGFSGVPSKPDFGLLGCGAVPIQARTNWPLGPAVHVSAAKADPMVGLYGTPEGVPLHKLHLLWSRSSPSASLFHAWTSVAAFSVGRFRNTTWIPSRHFSPIPTSSHSISGAM